MRNRKQTREDRGRRGDKIHLSGTENNALISLNLPARQDSALPGHVLGGDRTGTPKDPLAPALAGRATLPPRHSTREAGDPAPSSGLAKEQTAGCGWFRWEELARSARA